MKATFELLQLCLIMGYTLTTLDREKLASKIICTWWATVLCVDLFVWRGNRPPYVKEFLNCFDVGLGMVIIYAKFRHPVKHVFKLVLAFLVNVFR